MVKIYGAFFKDPFCKQISLGFNSAAHRRDMHVGNILHNLFQCKYFFYIWVATVSITKQWIKMIKDIWKDLYSTNTALAWNDLLLILLSVTSYSILRLNREVASKLWRLTTETRDFLLGVDCGFLQTHFFHTVAWPVYTSL